MPDIDWNTEYDADWAKEIATWPWKKFGDVLRVEGTCPRCSHHMSREIEHAPMTVRRVAATKQHEVFERVTIRCNCTDAHAGRPANLASGCGRAAVVSLPLT